VILNYNGKTFLERFLPSVKASTYAHLHIVVADNASTDDSLTFLRSAHPDVEILINKTNEGFAKGYNTALRQVKADILVLLNSDVEVTPNWIEPIVALMVSDKSIAACQPKILDWNNRTRFEYAGAAGGWVDRYGYPFCRGRIFSHCETDHGQYDTVEPVFWASGAAMFVRAAVFHEMGGFDDFFFAHQEEIDLCWRMQLSGYRVFACPASVVYHVGGGTLPQGNPKKTFLNFRNNLIMLYKNYRADERIWKIPYRLGLDAISAWKNLATGNSAYFIAVLKSHIAFAGWCLFHQKESIFPKTKKGKPAGLYPGNVIWMHFLRGMHTFREIITAKR
jgi:GT2 family glycosyltransferase